MPGYSAKRLHPQAYDALVSALTTFQWYKPDYARMVNSVFAADRSVLSGLDVQQSTKREMSREIVNRLQADEGRFQSLAIGALITLSEFNPDFAHLARLDDGATKVDAAKTAWDEVSRIVEQHKALLSDAEGRRAADEADAAAARQVSADAADRDALRSDFYQTSSISSPHARGLALEPFLNRLFTFYDLDPRGPFVLRGEQIDGAFTFDTDDYLLEARWRKDRVDPDQIRAFASKVSEKTHRTSGLMLSMDGFTPGALDSVRRKASPLLLMDGADLAIVLEGGLRLNEVLLRKRRHAAETGDPYLSAREMI